MQKAIQIDIITKDDSSNEYVLYLVEDGPWPTSESEWDSCLKVIQDRILSAVDVVIDGHLAGKYPESEGKAVRIQVDSPNGCPVQLENLVTAVRRYVEEDTKYSEAIDESVFISGLRIVTGKEMGRFCN